MPAEAPPTATQTGSLAVVVTLEENGCCSDFFSLKTLIFPFHFVSLHWGLFSTAMQPQRQVRPAR